jgi:site-specific DNA-cytosine methylase
MMGTKAAGSSKLATSFNERGLQEQRPDTCAEYFGGIGAAALALKGLYEPVAYFDNNSIAAETYNQHSPHVDQYGSMAEVLKDSTGKGSFVQQARTAEIAFCGPPCT